MSDLQLYKTVNTSDIPKTFFPQRFAMSHNGVFFWFFWGVFPSAPCAPLNVSASLVCANNTAAVRWQHTPGAVSYKVMAIGRDGDVKQCTTNDTSCHLPNMHCAQTYVITVTPFSNRCKGFDSNPLSYIAGKVESNPKVIK